MADINPPRRPLVLTKGWLAAAADDELLLRFHEPHLDPSDWAPVAVPGAWRSTPELATADSPVVYRCPVPTVDLGADDRAWLAIDGVFSEADVWFDGHYLGDIEGYFVPHAIELDPNMLGADHDHVLALEVRHNPASAIDAKHNVVGTYDDPRQLGPSWNPGGIWRPISIERSGPIRIVKMRVRCNEATAAAAVLALTTTIDAARPTIVTFTTTIGDTTHELEQEVTAGENRVEWLVSLPEPERWWPRSMGAQPLFDLVLTVATDGEASDRRTVRTGLRSVEMRNWILQVNDEPLFAKGVNVGPLLPDLAAVTPEFANEVLGHVVDAGFDLIRLRGHIAPPALYRAADELGILVWQDFPLWRGYSRRVRKKTVELATQAVNELAHHPSIAVWCAHDTPTPDGPDIESTARPARPRFGGARAAAGQLLPTWNKSVLDRSVRHAIDRADGSRPVVAHSGQWPHPPQFDGTDTHLWFGWRWGDLRDLAKLAGRMPRAVRWVSEFGAASVPDNAEFCEPQRWPSLPFERLADEHSFEPAAFDAHVPPSRSASFLGWRSKSQRYQAQAVRRQIETLRRLKYRPTGGFCLDQLIDARPAISTALVDHTGARKPAFEAAKQACAPVIVVSDRLPAVVNPGDALALDVHVVNDTLAEVAAAVRAELRWPGSTGTTESHRWAWEGKIGADDVARVGTISWVAPHNADSGTVVLVLSLTGDAVASNRYDAELSAR